MKLFPSKHDLIHLPLNLALRLLAIAVIWAAALGFGPAGLLPVQADASNQPAPSPTQLIAGQNCWGLDIVFLVSQSTMSNINDTFKLRMGGVRSAIDALGENVLFFCPGFTHRISVIGFGQLPGTFPTGTEAPTTIETYIPIPGKSGSDLIHPNLNNLAAWEDLKNNQLKTALTIKDLGYYSNYQGAFEAAAVQLKTWSNQKIDNLPRHRAVIVIGEGGLCTAEYACNNYKKVIDGLNKILDPGGAIFPFMGIDNPQSVQIFFLGIIARKSAATQFFDDPVINSFWTNITTSHGGSLEILQRGSGNLELNLNTDLAIKLGNVMNALLGSRLASNNCGPFWISPYLDDFTILHFFRKNAAGQNGVDKVTVAINGTQGKNLIAQYINGQVKAGTGQVIDYANPANEQYILYQTPPGLYSMTVQGGDFCQDIDLEIGQVGMIANVLSPAPNARVSEVDTAPYYDPANPFQFRVQLLQPNPQGVMQPLKELPDYPLTVKVSFKSQAGAQNPVSLTLPLTRVDDANAIYATQDPIQTRFANVYSWVITADTGNPRQFDPTSPDVAPIEVFKQEGVFTVGAVSKAFSFVVQNLGKTQRLPLVNGALTRPLGVTVQVVTPGNNTPFPSDQSIAPKTNPPFTATMTLPDGTTISRDLSPTDKNNAYSVSLPISADKPNAYTPGCYSIQVSLKSSFDRSIFQPSQTQTDPVSVCLVPSSPFVWNLVAPDAGVNYPLHPRLSLDATTVNLPITIKAFGASNEQLDPTQLQNSDQPVFSGVLTTPDNAKGIPIVFTPDKESGNFTAVWPADADKSGKYTLRVMLNTDNLNIAYYSPIIRLDPVQFTRNDDLLSQPWFPVVLIVGIVVLFFVFYWFFIGARLARAGRGQRIQG